MNNELTWQTVEKYLTEKNSGGSAMALIETEKILTRVFNKLKYPGKNNDQNILLAKKIITRHQDLEIARDTVKKIIQEPSKIIAFEETEKLLEAYYQTIRDLTKNQKQARSFSTRLKSYFLWLKRLPKLSWKQLLFNFILFLLVVWFLNRTSLGRFLVDLAVTLANFVFSWFLLTALLVISILVIVIGSIFFFESRKKKEQKNKVRVED